MFGRKIRVAALGAAGLGVCALVTACSPVQMGAAATLGSQRITTSSLDTQVSNLQEAAKPYGSQVHLTAAQMPAAVLGWMLRFNIMNQLAASAGIDVTDAEVQAGMADINQQAASAATQNGFPSAQAVFYTLGIPPSMIDDLGRYQAQEIAYAEKVNGGKLPSTTAQNNTVTAAITKGQCQAAKSLNIKVNPRFGRVDYTNYGVVAVDDKLSAPSGHGPTVNNAGLTPAC